MADVFALCTRETISCRYLAGSERVVVRSVPAWRYADFAVHERRERDGWTITHVPTGCILANHFCVFPSAEEAIAAMVEIQKLRNDWAVFPAMRGSDHPTLCRQIDAIGQRFFGAKGTAGPWVGVQADLGGVST